MSDKVYLVTEGSYSDYHVVAAFASKELAEEFAAGPANKWGDMGVEEYDVYSELPTPTIIYTGEVQREANGWPDDIEVSSYLRWPWDDDVSRRGEVSAWKMAGSRERPRRFTCQHTDREAVIKILSDRVAQEKALEAGIA
jgi:hypothetical protein